MAPLGSHPTWFEHVFAGHMQAYLEPWWMYAHAHAHAHAHVRTVYMYMCTCLT